MKIELQRMLMLKKLTCLFLFFSLSFYGSQPYFIYNPKAFFPQPYFSVSIALMKEMARHDPSILKYVDLSTHEDFLPLLLTDAYCEHINFQNIIRTKKENLKAQKNDIVIENALLPYCVSEKELPSMLSKNRKKLLYLSNKIFTLNQCNNLRLESELNRLISRCVYGVYLQDTSYEMIKNIFNYPNNNNFNVHYKKQALDRIDFNLALARFYLSSGETAEARKYFRRGFKGFLAKDIELLSLKDLIVNYDLCDFVSTRYAQTVVDNNLYHDYDTYLSLASIFLQQAIDKKEYKPKEQKLVNKLFFRGVSQWLSIDNYSSFEDLMKQYNLLGFLQKTVKLALRKRTKFSDNKLKKLVFMYEELLQTGSQEVNKRILSRIISLHKKMKVVDLDVFNTFLANHDVSYTPEIAFMVLQAQFPEGTDILNNQLDECYIRSVINICINHEVSSIVDTFAEHGCNDILQNFYERRFELKDASLLSLLDVYEYDLKNAQGREEYIDKIGTIHNQLKSVQGARLAFLAKNLLIDDYFSDTLTLYKKINHLNLDDLRNLIQKDEDLFYTPEIAFMILQTQLEEDGNLLSNEFYENSVLPVINVCINQGVLSILETFVEHGCDDILQNFYKRCFELENASLLSLLDVYEYDQKNAPPFSKESKKLIDYILEIYRVLDILPVDRFNNFVQKNKLTNRLEVQLLQAKALWQELRCQEYIDLDDLVQTTLKKPIDQLYGKRELAFKSLFDYGCNEVFDHGLEHKELLSDESLLLLLSLYAHDTRYVKTQEKRKILTKNVVECFYCIQNRNEIFWNKFSRIIDNANLDQRWEVVLFEKRSELQRLLRRTKSKCFNKDIQKFFSQVIDKDFNGERILLLQNFGILSLLENCSAREIGKFLRECYAHDLSLVDDDKKNEYLTNILNNYIAGKHYQKAVSFACRQGMHEDAWDIFTNKLSQEVQRNILQLHFFAQLKKKDCENIAQWSEYKLLFHIYGSLLKHDVDSAFTYLNWMNLQESISCSSDAFFLNNYFHMIGSTEKNSDLFSWISSWPFASHQQMVFSDLVKVCSHELIKENRIEDYINLIAFLMQNSQTRDLGLFQLVTIFILQTDKYNNLLDLPLFASMLLKKQQNIFTQDTISNDSLGLIIYYYLGIVKINNSVKKETIESAEKAFMHIKNMCFFKENRAFCANVIVVDDDESIESTFVLDDLRRIVRDGITPLSANDIYLLQKIKRMYGEFASTIFDYYLSNRDRGWYDDEVFITKINKYLPVTILCNNYDHVELLFDETIIIKNKKSLIDTALNNIYLFGLVDTLSQNKLIKSVGFCLDQLSKGEENHDISYNEIIHLLTEHLCDRYQYYPAFKTLGLILEQGGDFSSAERCYNALIAGVEDCTPEHYSTCVHGYLYLSLLNMKQYNLFSNQKSSEKYKEKAINNFVHYLKLAKKPFISMFADNRFKSDFLTVEISTKLTGLLEFFIEESDYNNDIALLLARAFDYFSICLKDKDPVEAERSQRLAYDFYKRGLSFLYDYELLDRFLSIAFELNMQDEELLKFCMKLIEDSENETIITDISSDLLEKTYFYVAKSHYCDAYRQEGYELFKKYLSLCVNDQEISSEKVHDKFYAYFYVLHYCIQQYFVESRETQGDWYARVQEYKYLFLSLFFKHGLLFVIPLDHDQASNEIQKFIEQRSLTLKDHKMIHLCGALEFLQLDKLKYAEELFEHCKLVCDEDYILSFIAHIYAHGARILQQSSFAINDLAEKIIHRIESLSLQEQPLFRGDCNELLKICEFLLKTKFEDNVMQKKLYLWLHHLIGQFAQIGFIQAQALLFSYSLNDTDDLIALPLASYLFADEVSYNQLIGLLGESPSEESQNLIEQIAHFSESYSEHAGEDVQKMSIKSMFFLFNLFYAKALSLLKNKKIDTEEDRYNTVFDAQFFHFYSLLKKLHEHGKHMLDSLGYDFNFDACFNNYRFGDKIGSLLIFLKSEMKNRWSNYDDMINLLESDLSVVVNDS